MSFEISGHLHKKFDTENKTDTFQAREFVIKTDGTYPQFVKFQLTQDRCSIVDSYDEGQMIKVYFDLRGREWNEKYFTNLNAWKIENSSSEASATPPMQTSQTPPPGFGKFETAPEGTKSTPAGPEAFDDLPF